MAAQRHGICVHTHIRAKTRLRPLPASLRDARQTNARLFQFQERAAERQRILDRIAEHLHETLDLDKLIERLFDEVNKAIQAEAQSLWLVDETGQGIVCRYATGPGAEQVTEMTVPYGAGIVGATVAKCEPLLIADAQRDARHNRRVQERTGIVTHSLMSVPLVRGGKAIGAMQAINKQPEGQRFEASDLEMLLRIADIAALSLENARLYAELENSYHTTLEALAAALDARDRETEGHSRRVVAYSACLAEAAGFSPEDIRSPQRGALIHDVGKIGVPDAILQKPAALTPEERAIINTHPEIGFAMLQGISHLREELDVVRFHHERWDGGGYPFGLSGEQIPRCARLFAIIDTYDAVTSDRPYRLGRSDKEAIQVLRDESGRQFDPQLVECFLELPVDSWAILRANAIQSAAAKTAAPRPVDAPAYAQSWK